MKVGLFVPCYVDQFYPGAAIATLKLLEKLGVEVVYPPKQTCCGQPMANSGFEHLTIGCNELFIKNFEEFEYIVAPSGSCVLHIRDHLHDDKQPEAAKSISNKIYELTAFLTDVLKVKKLSAKFPHRVGIHQSCHGQRGLHISSMTELVAPEFSKPLSLLQMVDGIDLLQLSRKDECCGFGGTFCVTEEAVSVKMGKDRVADHLEHGAEYITGVDMSCLMHMEGILKRQGSKVKVIHIAEILNAG
ncbi:L-lactate dehydrogenase complex protein LldE [Mucilaginibacter frigoritolerans]|jgi:L-lactate dehydrogenase complex protein LldE|uniref:L-lactate dehydrogenase complex protein LldE n=1 Tax=Mucilaginibacter frigoritolerans TaxID=652788 RepID=A0A562TP11_9SPHI|nr:(Fe-S)-binding protein [Mucilaginibacter frigoritolerans]TWI95311.1 L-lactate dehydrogenase complex protein LldE [Mucilaginibacter frigoritolerans]